MQQQLMPAVGHQVPPAVLPLAAAATPPASATVNQASSAAGRFLTPIRRQSACLCPKTVANQTKVAAPAMQLLPSQTLTKHPSPPAAVEATASSRLHLMPVDGQHPPLPPQLALS
jgi:hypothetical protein